VGADGALWFTEQNVNRIGRITTAGVITEFPVPSFDSRPGRQLRDDVSAMRRQMESGGGESK